MNPDHLVRKPTAPMVGVLSRPQLCSSSSYRSTPKPNRCSLCTAQQRLALLVVLMLRDPNRCGLLEQTSCAKWNPKTDTHLMRCSQGSRPDSSHRSHACGRRRGNHRAVCALAVQLAFVTLRSPQPVTLGQALGTALLVHLCSLQRVTGL